MDEPTGDNGLILPQADAVRWLGLCPCGCGTFKALLVDENDGGIATFGWDREGWVQFLTSVLDKVGVQ